MSEDIPQPANRDIEGRNTDGTFAKGVSGNPSGRPRNTLKDFARQQFVNMSDDEKRTWLTEHKIAGIDIWKMAEGNPKEHTEVEVSGELKTTLASEVIAQAEKALQDKLTNE